MTNQSPKFIRGGEELLEKVRNLLKSEGVNSRNKLEVENEVEEYLLPAMDKFRDVQRFVYEPFLHSKAGFKGKIKTLVLSKMGNVARNVVERSFARQQKYNDNVYTMLMHLYTENRELKKRVSDLESPTKNDAK
jgi:hypothetical protein